MKQQIHVFYRATSFIMAICILTVSCFTFQGCSYKEDYSVLNENNQAPKVLKNITLSEFDELIVNFKIFLSSKQETNKNLKSAIVDKIVAKFGEPNWKDNQLVNYDNGLQGLYIPIIKEEKTTAFILSKPENGKFKSIILEVLSTETNRSNLFSGTINYYTISGDIITSHIIEEGKYMSSKEDFLGIKSTLVEDENDCSFSCLQSCVNNVLDSDPSFTFLCGLSCGGAGTVIGLVICIACVGGTALFCLDECCVNIAN